MKILPEWGCWGGALKDGWELFQRVSIKKNFSHEVKCCHDNSSMPATWRFTAAFLTCNFIHMSKQLSVVNISVPILQMSKTEAHGEVSFLG